MADTLFTGESGSGDGSGAPAKSAKSDTKPLTYFLKQALGQSSTGIVTDGRGCWRGTCASEEAFEVIRH